MGLGIDMRRTPEQDTYHARGFAAGIAVAAAICVSAYGQEVCAEEILKAAGFDTAAKAKRSGADEYDLQILRLVFEHISRKRRKICLRESASKDARG
jgi:hypothetical protein